MTDFPNSPPDLPEPELALWLHNHRLPGEPHFDADGAWRQFEARHRLRRVAIWQRPAFIGAAAVALAAAAVFVALRLRPLKSADQPADMIQVVALDGRPKIVTLDDGSRIMLHGGTTLRYPSRGSDRDVYLDGQALFEIIHDPTRAFRVHAGHTVVRDIGTQFTVRAFANEHSVQVAVREGRVAFARDSQPGDTLDLGAGDAGMIDSAGSIGKLPPSAVERLLGWTTGAMVFDNVQLSAAAAEIERRYGVSVVVADSALARRPVVARFHGEAVRQVLDALALALGAHYDVAGTTYTLRPGRQ